MEDKLKNEDKGGLGIGVGRQKNKTAYDLGSITPKIKLVVVVSVVNTGEDQVGRCRVSG
jgi:hypothetical protein